MSDSLANRERGTIMGEYCTHASIRRHPANPGEVLKVQRLFRHDEAGLFGEHDEIACIPPNGWWIEIVGTAVAAHPEVNLLLPGEVLRCTRSFFFGDRLELPSGRKVRLRDLVGFRLPLLTRTGPTPPAEEAIVTRATREAEHIRRDPAAYEIARRVP